MEDHAGTRELPATLLMVLLFFGPLVGVKAATFEEFYNQIDWSRPTNNLAQGVFTRPGESICLVYVTSHLQHSGLAVYCDGIRWVKISVFDEQGQVLSPMRARKSQNELFDSLLAETGRLPKKGVGKRSVLSHKDLLEVGHFDLRAAFGENWIKIVTIRVEQIVLVYGPDREYHATLLSPLTAKLRRR